MFYSGEAILRSIFDIVDRNISFADRMFGLAARTLVLGYPRVHSVLYAGCLRQKRPASDPAGHGVHRSNLPFLLLD